MHTGKPLFAQPMGHLPPMVFERCVARYGGHYKVQSSSCMDRFLGMAFAQPTFREGLRDIEACLRSRAEKLYHMGIRGQVARNTLANDNEPFGVDLANTAYALDSTTIDSSLSLFPWAPFRTFDQTLMLQGYQSAKDYPQSFRGIRYRDPETGKRRLFITDNTALPASKTCALYKARWRVELFFRCIKQHLRIKAFVGTSENAVRSQIWIAVSVHVLVAIVKKRLALSRSLYEILPIPSLNPFEKTPLDAALTLAPASSEGPSHNNQLVLFT